MSLKKILKIIFLLFISIYSAEAQVEKLRSVNLGIIPKTQNIVNVGELLSWDPKINVAFEKELSDQGECLIIFLKERGIQVSSKARKTLFLSKKKIKQNNESYEIKINEDSVRIHGNSIAGSYSPFCLVVLEPDLGLYLFIAVWIFALTGIILKLFFTGRFDKISTVMYLLMGWQVLFFIKPLIAALTSFGLNLLIAGGIFYTVGAILYSIKKMPYNHATFHVFVLLGSVSHFLALYFL